MPMSRAKLIQLAESEILLGAKGEDTFFRHVFRQKVAEFVRSFNKRHFFEDSNQQGVFEQIKSSLHFSPFYNETPALRDAISRASWDFQPVDPGPYKSRVKRHMHLWAKAKKIKVEAKYYEDQRLHLSFPNAMMTMNLPEYIDALSRGYMFYGDDIVTHFSRIGDDVRVGYIWMSMNKFPQYSVRILPNKNLEATLTHLPYSLFR